MITETTKAIAKARLSQNITCEEIAAELELPVKLIEEWASNLTTKDNVIHQATLLAVDKISRTTSGDLVPLLSDVLKQTLEETAIDLTRAISIPALNGDVVHAKTIQMLADAVVKLYQTIILKNGEGNAGRGGSYPSNSVLDTFAEIMKD